MNSIINAAIEHFRVVLLCLALIFIGGSVAYMTIPKEDRPDVTIPLVYIHLHHDGISPEDSARLLIKPMEVTLKTIEGVKEIRGIAQENGASIIVEFTAGTDPDLAILDVREQVDKARSELPEETDEPSVNEISTAIFPILTVVLYGDVPERVLYNLSRRLRDDIETIPSILDAKVNGDREDLLEIIIDPLKLESYQLSPTDILTVVSTNNKLVAAGSLDTGSGRFSVKIPGVFESALDVYNLPLKVSGNSVVTLADVAEVRRTYKEPTTYSRFNGRSAVSISLTKRAGENTFDAVARAKAIVEESAKNWPKGLQHAYLGDQSVEVRNSISSLQNSVISAILLVAIAIVIALGNRAAFLVAVTIPGSFLLSIFLLEMFGFTINRMVLFGLILSVGLLVDGSIVVSEYADRKLHEGLDKKEAYKLAAQRMAWPILASTATTLAAFFPLLFWPGTPGEFMRYVPLTLIYTLSASFLMALIFMPTLGSKIGKREGFSFDAASKLAASDHFSARNVPGLTGTYVRLVDRLIRHPFRVIAVISVIIVAVFIVFANARVPVEFFPKGIADKVMINIHARGNLSLDERDILVRSVERRIAHVDGIETSQTRTVTGLESSSDATEDVIGQIILNFENWKERRDSDEIIDELRRKTANIPGLVVEIVLPKFGPEQGKDIQIEVKADDIRKAAAAASLVYQKLETIPGLSDLDSTLPLPGIQWELKVDRAMAGLYETSLLSVGNMVQLVTNGVKVGEYRPDDTDDEVDIRVRFPEKYRNLEQLDDVRVWTREGLVPISNFVKREAKQKISSIERIDTLPTFKVRSNVVDIKTRSTIVAELQQWLSQQQFDPSVKVSFAGQDEDQKEAFEFLIEAFIMALFLMCLILVTQFNSFYNAFLILLSVLLSTAGVLIGIVLFDRSFQVVMTGVGIISLAGIVVNNNIVLIDTYDRLYKAGADAYDAIVQTVAQRLRPVMLTTVTTVIGLMPMVFQMNIDFANRTLEVGSPYSAVWVDLALAVSVGLVFATVLTLLLTPCLLAAKVKISLVMGKRRDQKEEKRKLKRVA
ncbi:efflux RND transporter permease subunit [Emcibacter nanhaiensis]|uniref:Efflux RND transporter permease subunit n=1 Tax=Emcibacter nanhaiensis TaxID=1505037 RepID=A0A501PRT4_9PROT|nr:efflux RND transporter permease subunit [Emcibacter nanhaiensis]TPD62868.1 efflux RND transporter permease subunit [Emcibacter nanhaiensis]